MKFVVGFITYGELTAKYLPYFLESLTVALETSVGQFKILAVDNSPSRENENARYIKKNYPEIAVEWAGKNLGFAQANNRMVRQAVNLKAEYFLMLNPDIVLEPDAIEKIIRALDKDNRLGSASPKILRWDFKNNKKTNIIDSCGIELKPGLRFVDARQGLTDKGQFNHTKILGPSGAAGMYRISALEKIKDSGQYFDEIMFMYKEDCDLAYRLFLAGFKSRCVNESIVYHDRTARAEGDSSWQIFLNQRNKDKQVKEWSFLNQHIIFLKYWQRQNFRNKLAIIWQEVKIVIFVLLFERYLLQQYRKLKEIRHKIRIYS